MQCGHPLKRTLARRCGVGFADVYKRQRLFLHARKLKEVGLGTTEPQAFAEALRADGWPLEQGKLYTEKELAGMIAAACDAGSSENGAAWPSQAGSEGQVIE